MTAIAQRRVAGATALMILLYLLQVALYTPTASADHATAYASGNPSNECGWEGEGSIPSNLYRKYQYNGSFMSPEGTADVTVALSDDGFTYQNNEDTLKIYRIILKVGQGVGTDVVLGDHNVAQSGELAIPNGLSHVTFCLWTPPTTTTSSTTSSSTTSSSTSSTTSTTSTSTTSTTQPTTTTTQPTTTTTEGTTTTTEATTTTTEPDEEVLGTTITTVPEVSADTLPFTGSESGDLFKLAMLALTAGALMLFAVRGPKEEDEAAAEIGGWSSL